MISAKDELTHYVSDLSETEAEAALAALDPDRAEVRKNIRNLAEEISPDETPDQQLFVLLVMVAEQYVRACVVGLEMDPGDAARACVEGLRENLK